MVGETDPVPFITAFVSERLDSAQQQDVRAALLEVGKRAELLAALESLVGFVPIDAGEATPADSGGEDNPTRRRRDVKLARLAWAES